MGAVGWAAGRCPGGGGSLLVARVGSRCLGRGEVSSGAGAGAGARLQGAGLAGGGVAGRRRARRGAGRARRWGAVVGRRGARDNLGWQGTDAWRAGTAGGCGGYSRWKRSAAGFLVYPGVSRRGAGGAEKRRGYREWAAGGCDEPERYGTGERAGAFLWWILGLSRAGRQRSGERVSSGCGGLGGLMGRFMPARGPKCSGPIGSSRAGRQARGWWVAEVLGSGCGLVVYPKGKEKRRAGGSPLLAGCSGRLRNGPGVGGGGPFVYRRGKPANARGRQMRRRPAEGAGVGEGVIAGCSDCIVQSLHCAIRSRRWGARGAGQGV